MKIQVKTMKTLYLLRGLPGAGKSTLANQLSPNICEADMYFIRNGEYQFDMDLLGVAHLWCRTRCEDFMKGEESTIVVSNTLTCEKELAPYIELAEKYQYRIVSLIIENRHGNNSVHNVPNETLDRMEVRLKGNIKLR
jgi:predicted kinase